MWEWCCPVNRFRLLFLPAAYSALVTFILQDMNMITVEKSDPFSSESHRLIEMLSAELAAITGDNGKSNFTVEAMYEDKALWALAKNAWRCNRMRSYSAVNAVNILELKRNVLRTEVCQELGELYLLFLETSAKEMGYSELRLGTRHINQRAVKFPTRNMDIYASRITAPT